MTTKKSLGELQGDRVLIVTFKTEMNGASPSQAPPPGSPRRSRGCHRLSLVSWDGACGEPVLVPPTVSAPVPLSCISEIVGRLVLSGGTGGRVVACSLASKGDPSPSVSLEPPVSVGRSLLLSGWGLIGSSVFV